MAAYLRPLALALVVAACGESSDAGSKPATPTASPHKAAGWRYLPTLREAVPAGVTVEPIIEVATPDQARLHIVAAVHRPGETPQLRIEEWSFTQHNQKGTLAQEFEPKVILRTQAEQPVPDGQDSLRLRLASPGAQVQRPVGLDVDGPAALLQRLSGLAATVRDSKAEPAARVQALSSLVHGLDDALVIEKRGLPAAIDDLAAGRWKSQTVRDLSERRKVVDIGGEPPRQLQVVRKSSGWIVTGVGPAQP